MKRTYIFSILPLFTVFFTQSVFSSEEEKLYEEIVSKLFKSPVLETANHLDIPEKIKKEYMLKIKPLLIGCKELKEWSLKKCTIGLLQEKEILEKERRAFEKVQKYSVRIYGRVLNALEKKDCFISVSQETYNRFPTAQWNPQKEKNCSPILPETPVNNAMKFYDINNKYYMVLYQENIDMCDRFLDAIYGQKFDGFGEEESKYVENHFIFIREEIEAIIELLGTGKKQVISKDTGLDANTIQELLK